MSIDFIYFDRKSKACLQETKTEVQARQDEKEDV